MLHLESVQLQTLEQGVSLLRSFHTPPPQIDTFFIIIVYGYSSKIEMLFFADVFMLGGITYPNNTAVILEHIGEEDKNSLLCITTDIHCCQTNKQGNFYYPNGELVLPLSQASSSRQNLYLTHNNGSISLKRQPGETFPPLGKYRCEIPDTRGTLQNLFINIGKAILTLDVKSIRCMHACMCCSIAVSCRNDSRICRHCKLS